MRACTDPGPATPPREYTDKGQGEGQSYKAALIPIYRYGTKKNNYRHEVSNNLYSKESSYEVEQTLQTS